MGIPLSAAASNVSASTNKAGIQWHHGFGSGTCAVVRRRDTRKVSFIK
jgi:hypothetical protein